MEKRYWESGNPPVIWLSKIKLDKQCSRSNKRPQLNGASKLSLWKPLQEHFATKNRFWYSQRIEKKRNCWNKFFWILTAHSQSSYVAVVILYANDFALIASSLTCVAFSIRVLHAVSRGAGGRSSRPAAAAVCGRSQSVSSAAVYDPVAWVLYSMASLSSSSSHSSSSSSLSPPESRNWCSDLYRWPEAATESDPSIVRYSRYLPHLMSLDMQTEHCDALNRVRFSVSVFYLSSSLLLF